MFTSLDAISSDTHLETDICIVGTGPAGITLALEMIGSGKRVIVLESGSTDFDQATQNLYAGTIRRDLPPIPLNASRLRLFGGTSNHWAGHCAPFNDIDFEERGWINESGWPIRRSELEPYYQRAQTRIGLGQYNYDPAFWDGGSGLLFDLADTPIINTTIQMCPTRFGVKYGKELESAEDVRVIFNANLTWIHVREAFDRVTSLEVRSLRGSTISVASRHTVLACGGVENARLLLNSGFERNLPCIGRYYSFHPRLETARLYLNRPLGKDTSPYDWHENRQTVVRTMLRLKQDAQQSEQIANHAAILQVTRLADSPGYSALKRIRARLIGDESLRGFIDDIKVFLRDIEGTKEEWKHFHSGEAQEELAVITYMDQMPNPESRISLDGEKDILGLRKAQVDWNYFETERESIRRFNEQLALGLSGAGIGRVQVAPDLTDKTTFEQLMRQDSGGGHQIGTTRMSSSPANGVVDRNCRVHGMENLYCTGSSVFPTTSWINPTMTIVALSCRLADHLKSR